MSQTYEATITVADNGYLLDFAPMTGADSYKRDTLVFLTAYQLGQWIDTHLPKPPGDHNKNAAPTNVIAMLTSLEDAAPTPDSKDY